MTNLNELVHLNPNFARSTRLDVDFSQGKVQEGFVLQASTAKSLLTMANAQLQDGQGAYTWTGPYGSGKSSAALLLAHLIGGDDKRRSEAAQLLGPEVSQAFREAFRFEGSLWRVLPVTGRRTDLQSLLADYLAPALGWSTVTVGAVTSGELQLVEAILTSLDTAGSSLLLFLDELGRVLEHAAASDTDVHLLQDLAEASTRSNGRLVIIGILHQSFEQYASRLGREPRQEWMKIQGRFLDLSFLTRVDETASLISRAIQAPATPVTVQALAHDVARAVSLRRPVNVETLSEVLGSTWPLNPVTTLLLGPIARQRFAQNERSVFGFLMSAEPFGFVEFLKATSADSQRLYGPSELWDYLDANFGLMLAGGRDGHLFSLAHEAIARASARGNDDHLAVVKSAALLELFGQGTGLQVNDAVLATACPKLSVERLQQVIADLLEWAIFVRQPRLAGYAIFAGSDFDLEEAVAQTARPLTVDESIDIPKRLGLSFVTAKRHYFHTGVLRAFDVTPFPVEEGTTVAEALKVLTSGALHSSGRLILLLPDSGVTAEGMTAWQKDLADALARIEFPAAVGRSAFSERLSTGSVELFALETIISKYPQLQGDRIARREIASRRSLVISDLHRDFVRILDEATWTIPGEEAGFNGPLVDVASMLADAVFDQTPVVQSELIQRDRLSSSAAAAQRELMYAMVRSPEVENLGMSGFPAAMGLHLTILANLGLHRKLENGKFGFATPSSTYGGKSLKPAWKKLKSSEKINLGDVFDVWAASPYGIKQGLMPIIALAYFMAESENISIYVDNHYEVDLNDIFVDRLLQSPRGVEFKRITRKTKDSGYLAELALRLELTEDSSPLVVAQHLFRRFALLPEFAKRSNALSSNALQIRDAVLNASDPEVLLFETMRSYELSSRAQIIADAIMECEMAFNSMLGGLRAELAEAIGVPASSFRGVTERAVKIQGVGGDLRFDNFLMRLSAFEQEVGDIAGLAGMLVGKPTAQWVDRDVERASVEIVKLARQFREFETLTFVKNREPSAKALALAVGVRMHEPTRFARQELSQEEDDQAYGLAEEFMIELKSRITNERIRFGTLAHLVELLLPQSVEEVG